MANLSLIQFKRIFTPLVAIIMVFLLFLVFPKDIPWFSAEFAPKLLKFESNYVLLLFFGGSGLGFLLLAEILGRVNLHYDFVDFSKSSFITALKRNDWFGLLLQFPLIILVEEVLFRVISLKLLSLIFTGWSVILVSSLIFCLYHLHIYLSSRDWNLTSVYLGFSFILGINLAILFPYVGIIGCWLYHVVCVAAIYLRWGKLIEKIDGVN